ncbi:hypothetical protein [Riemerella anatipestifer]|uniref:hypothetical protein n=1 Tax=Riemerella anatipestifer TaxID=34085 RepID=UPI001BDABED5|nr:hypothetical protein [Riemerella anatipestifer]MBT0552298.1 hypothetical protein [Riemerella anatipestifer]MBT0554532.1 hypothetical protein [Riemerella anatipestifer]MCE3025042.1 hypothetical protein [Riemerella anatipestifer]MCU7560683.1 hypothetical protein [Riemerella anatipestifer]MDY3450055.1 hypothetical protein [Riemerella anatipestifer]
MKTTATKLSVLAFLGLGLAVYGQSGKVGVNISLPRATLDVQPNATNSQDNAKTNEGILAPQLSKTRVASIEAPVEGTLVYVIDDSTKTNGAISNYTGNDTKVAKITEKGYYYYNGTEWVKSTGNNDDIWQKQNSGNIRLIDSEIKDIVQYTPTGSYQKYPKTQSIFQDYNSVTNQIQTKNISELSGNFIFLNSSSSPTSNDIYGDISGWGEHYIYNVDKIEGNTGTNGNFIGQNHRLIIPTDTSIPVRLVRTGSFTAEKLDNGNTLELTSIAARTFDVGGGNTRDIRGAGIATSIQKPAGSIKNAYGSLSLFSTLEQNIAPIEQLIGVYSVRSLKGSGNIIDSYGFFSRSDTSTYSGTITNSYDFYATGNVRNATNQYGIYINGSEKTNYIEGKTGIGVTAPTEKLEVAGNVKATGFVGTNAAIFPDYVFQKYYTGTSSLKADYSFKTLSQVEDFVKTNGHLPGYKSAAEIKKQGYIDLMATQLTNVEKIEELYLHSIEQDKALKAKDAEIKELKERLSKIEALLSK